jgi:multisubunit Na+/H+ antiporter MnhG subunit
MSDVVSLVLICLGSLVLVVGAVGAAVPRSPLVRLHYVSLSAMLGAPLVLGGAVVRDPADAFKLLLIGALLLWSSPAAGAATARALRRTSAGRSERP